MDTKLEVDLSELDAEMLALVRDEMLRGWHVQEVMSRTRQARIGEASARIQRQHIDGLGEYTMQIDPTVYHYWNNREPGCWQDAKFRREFRRDNPEVRVQSRSPKIRVFGGMDHAKTQSRKEEGIVVCAR